MSRPLFTPLIWKAPVVFYDSFSSTSGFDWHMRRTYISSRGAALSMMDYAGKKLPELSTMRKFASQNFDKRKCTKQK